MNHHFLQRLSLIALALLAVLAPSCADADEKPVAPRSPRTIILVRHGQYADNHKDESPGPGLTPLGIAQAKLAGARLGAMPGKFDVIYASPMTRAQETAKLISAELPGVPLQTLPDLAECTPPTRRTEVTRDEKPSDMSRCAAKLDAIFKEKFVPSVGGERRELMVCHGNVTRYLVTKALGVDTASWLEMSVAHASLTQIRVEPDGRFKVISIGDIGHIPPDLQSGSTGMPERSLAVPK